MDVQAASAQRPEDYIKVHEGEAYDGRKYYISYVSIEELSPDVKAKFREYLKGSTCPIIPGVKYASYSHDWIAFTECLNASLPPTLT